MQSLFRRIAVKVSGVMGSPYAFLLSVLVIVVWAVSGPVFGFSDTWQLVINTGTTIVTFLMVFLIQNTQNRDSKAVHLKLDELIKSSRGSSNSFIDLEDMSDEEIAAMDDYFHNLRDEDQASPAARKIKAHAASRKARTP